MRSNDAVEEQNTSMVSLIKLALEGGKTNSYLFIRLVHGTNNVRCGGKLLYDSRLVNIC